MNNDAFFFGPELDYRRDRNRREIAEARSGRSRTSWLRRIAAADRNLRNSQD